MAKQTPAHLPPAFLSAIQDIMPQHLSMDDFISACQRPLRRSIRVNTLKISTEAFLNLVAPYQWRLEPIPWCSEGFWLLNADDEIVRLGNTLEHLSGLFYIQEASSMLPVSALFQHQTSPQRVLDVAAAPGSKTTQIAARMDNRGGIVANEYSASRVKVLHANISRCGVGNTALTHFDGRVFGAALPEYFDAILLDAPCSGEGVVRKDPGAMSHWSPESIASIAATQRELILSAFHALKPGGVMIYSTCTLNTQENQQVCHWLRQTFPDACEFEPLTGLFPGAALSATQEGFLHVFPQIYDSEGFFVARLRKTASVPPLPAPDYKVGKFPFAPLTAKDRALVTQAARRQGLEWDENRLQLWQRDNEIWLFPAELASAFGKIRFSRIGIKLAERFPKGYRWQHEAIIALANVNAGHAYALDDQQACEWFQGKDSYPQQVPAFDELLLTYHNCPVGLAKRIGSRIKNNLPRDLVRDGACSAAQDNS
ncbi:16S rRNA (cytosine(1407)-C(5))-methyltransferase RsmF [Brenneria izadpanahii]|uniref:Ribosomal RNA small subunit methyltransferase F n=1 Tax=Brenneria izadpanahii TaxID=2722756 RepID=A0ABX7URF9_9GAMM|nr:16S rRNA (cytosine(1407)-C(5))-methyltransferase RsmF [Brenneria izadpanahii]QTF08199.1 16S rRNA (cytosine(1407)-C(5))-methyltransferase RsmF [Brenneria izadpanahii]